MHRRMKADAEEEISRSRLKLDTSKLGSEIRSLVGGKQSLALLQAL